MTTHSEILEHLIDLFEIGVQTITLCAESKNAFLASRNATKKASIVVFAGAAQLGFGAVTVTAYVAHAINSFPNMTHEDWEALIPPTPEFGDY